MAIKRVEPPEAARLLSEGWTYVDVRSTHEFDQGHPEGAYNLPLLHFVPGAGMKPNPDFVAEFTAAFNADDKLVLGCKSGGRSARATEILMAEGYSEVVDMRGGFAGEVDRTGQVTCKGWSARGLPTATTPEPERDYGSVKARGSGSKG